MTSNDLRTELKNRIVEVTFKKVNGDIRVMSCTTNPDLIPPSQWPQGKVTVSEETAEKTFRVYDTKAQSWRSFKKENVIEVK